MKPFSYSPEEITYSEWKHKLLKLNRPLVWVWVCVCVVGDLKKEKTRTNLATWLAVKTPNCVNACLDDWIMPIRYFSFSFIAVAEYICLNMCMDTACVCLCVYKCHQRQSTNRNFSVFSFIQTAHTHTQSIGQYNYGLYKIFGAMVYRYKFCFVAAVIQIENLLTVSTTTTAATKPTANNEQKQSQCSCFHNFVVFFSLSPCFFY